REEPAGLCLPPAGVPMAADPGREAEVVTVPARTARLAAEAGALDDEGLETFGGCVHRGGESRRAGPDDQQVDLLPREQLAAAPEPTEHFAARGPSKLGAARNSNQRECAGLRRRGLLPGVGQPVGSDKVDD